MRRPSLRLAAALAGVSVIAAGCGGSAADGVTSRAAAARQRGATKQVVVCDPAFSYKDLAQLRRNATSVVVFTATGASTVRKIADIPFTISAIAIRERVAGRGVPSTVTLRQTGAAGVQGCETLVSPNHVYLAYLAPFRLQPGRAAVRGQYVAVGLFEHAGSIMPSESAPSFSSLIRGQPSLPAEISIAQAGRS
jgi:hypothetical protein